MPQVTFTIKGLVACYRKPVNSEEWSFIFPHGGHHQAYLYYTQGGGGPLITPDPPISLANKIVTIASVNSVAPTEYSTERFLDHVLDITDWRLHNEGLEKKQDNRKMTVKHAVLDSFQERDNRFALAMQFDGPNRPPANIQLITNPISELIKGTIEITDGAQVVINIVGGPVIPPLVAGDSFEIDNYCGSCQRDFLKYHNLFKNKRNPRKFCDVLSIEKFTLDAEKNPLFPLGEPPAFCDGVRIGGDPSGLD